MAERLDLYKCEMCGTIVQVFNRGDGELVCCGKLMKYLQKFTKENEYEEKHVPVFVDNKVQVGSVPHPMSSEHHIKFIETISNDKKHIEVQFLNVTDNPEMNLAKVDEGLSAIEYCNIHGLWES